MRRSVIALLLAGLAAGCGDDEEPTVVETGPQTGTVTEPAAATRSTRTAPSSATGAEPPSTIDSSSDCRQLGRLRLRVISGDAPCGEVREVAGGYDLSGEKVQDVSGWTCSGGTADTRPIVFTCTLGDREFAAEEGGG
jgi:hypothetical protein